MNAVVCSTQSLVRCQALAARPAPRRHALAVRASRDAELKKMQDFKAGLNKHLEASKRPGATAAAAGDAAAVSTEAPAAGKKLQEVTQADFYDVIGAAGDRLVVVDCYTDWCGPCKMILPTLQQWAEELEGRCDIVKFNCNKANKELGVKLGIKVAPTFLLYKRGEQVAMMTGAKAEQLRELIDKHM
ncbi:thioredoxin F- chloroplastic-like [Chlorella sorokiniana]|jgi:thioredoxin 1|uniref:Thioredoxin F-chloroplastic-like n=1 Tax=Chlorella sorokiniana TaxID=3076 RepID=A0A2P6TB67_CHLSO|nr:thioredoxin F- chloroplastic-like [Chlorella sorokiniana]|eukprot:PRW05787.1 thioredoxin F- chloroplastic-like [Chlorella sorokiniana]